MTLAWSELRSGALDEGSEHRYDGGISDGEAERIADEILASPTRGSTAEEQNEGNGGWRRAHFADHEPRDNARRSSSNGPASGFGDPRVAG